MNFLSDNEGAAQDQEDNQYFNSKADNQYQEYLKNDQINPSPEQINSFARPVSSRQGASSSRTARSGSELSVLNYTIDEFI